MVDFDIKNTPAQSSYFYHKILIIEVSGVVTSSDPNNFPLKVSGSAYILIVEQYITPGFCRIFK
jgi:hypothetical protein